MSKQLVVVVLLSAFLCGCGSGGPQRAAVQGEVTLGGRPLEKGSILFRPTEDTKGPTAGGRIENGRYEISRKDGPLVGMNRIEINAFQPTGRQVPKVIGNPEAGLMDEVIEVIPKKYNVDSTLVREVNTDSNILDFHL